jgi:multidrug resistance efflux pump
VVTVALVAVVVVLGLGKAPGREQAAEFEVVATKPDLKYQFSLTQPAYIDPYLIADLRAQVAGVVENVVPDIGKKVHQNDPLIKIHVPDLVQDVAKKKALVEQRRRERLVAYARVTRAMAQVEVARWNIKVKEALVKVAQATSSFREEEWKSFRSMAGDQSVAREIERERKTYYEAALAEDKMAGAARGRAEAEAGEARAKLQEVEADYRLKNKMVEVAKRDLAQAEALLGYATVRAPFDGTITRRFVDQGSFVQNSTGSPGPSLLTIQRTDIVTIYSNIPDVYAPYVQAPAVELGKGDAANKVVKPTWVEIELSELPGLKVKVPLSRESRSLLTTRNDRTKRVEVDIYNLRDSTYNAFAERKRADHYANLKNGALPRQLKLEGELPMLARNLGLSEKDPDHLLLPGSFCTMRLLLDDIKPATLLPLSAVFSKGGRHYICTITSTADGNGVVHLNEVEFLDDGILAKVSILERNREGKVIGRRDVRPGELVVLKNQGELADGQEIHFKKRAWGLNKQNTRVEVDMTNGR